MCTVRLFTVLCVLIFPVPLRRRCGTTRLKHGCVHRHLVRTVVCTARFFTGRSRGGFILARGFEHPNRKLWVVFYCQRGRMMSRFAHSRRLGWRRAFCFRTPLHFHPRCRLRIGPWGRSGVRKGLLWVYLCGNSFESVTFYLDFSLGWRLQRFLVRGCGGLARPWSNWWRLSRRLGWESKVKFSFGVFDCV